MYKKITLNLLALGLLLFSCSSNDKDILQPMETGVLTFDAGPDHGNKMINVHYYVPEGVRSNMPFQVIMHGMGRNADGYLASWSQKAREYSLITIAPEFKSELFSSAEYNEGNYRTSQGTVNPPERTTFYLIDRIFEFVKEELDLDNSSYNIYGHSAGSQFVHRMVLLYESPYRHIAVAANAGWYTFPDELVHFPYGIRGLFEDNDAIRANYYEEEMVVLLGTADTLRTSNLRQTYEADQQGRNRFERGISFFEYNKDRAASSSQLFNWSLHYVEDAGHSNSLMAPPAADILYGNQR